VTQSDIDQSSWLTVWW